MAWYRKDKEAVAEALRRGERPDLATTMASGPLDELVALHEELGIFALLDELEVPTNCATCMTSRHHHRRRSSLIETAKMKVTRREAN
jgi:hypothetical protein